MTSNPLLVIAFVVAATVIATWTVANGLKWLFAWARRRQETSA